MINNPLEGSIIDNPFYDFTWDGSGGIYANANKDPIDPNDILGVNAAVADITKTINDNIPSYLIGAFGIILIAAGVYSLAK